MSFKEMRRSDRALAESEARALLEKGIYGILSTVGEDGLPVGTPLSYIVDGDDICFHCAQKGQKVDNLRHQPRVCFTVVGEAQAAYLGNFTTYFESAVAHGTASPVEGDAEKTRILRLICEKYLPEHMEHFAGAMEKSLKVTGIWKIHIDHLTGKARR